MDSRIQVLIQWLQNYFTTTVFAIEPITNDASFRRYFRVRVADKHFIAMDAPPPQEDCRPFVNVARQFAACNMRVPHIFAEDVEQGFLLLEDFGDRQFAHALTTLSPNPSPMGTWERGTIDVSALNISKGIGTPKNNATSKLNTEISQLYQDGLNVLLRLQQCNAVALPAYDTKELRREFDVLRPWFLERHLNLTLTPAQEQLLENVFTLLIENALQQPQVCVHRDYHSRNLMLLPNNDIGMLDFQCAVIGPITYDVVSLLRDCYIAWPEEQVTTWALDYWQQLRQVHLLAENITAKHFLRWFDLMGLHRHLKVLGVFSRLNHRDNKPLYLADLPRVMQYVLQVSAQYPELKDLYDWFKKITL